jgi:hypothetical protein
MRYRIAIIGLLGLCGCVGPWETRYLTWWQRPVAVEARSWDSHDPFPDKYAGPDTYNRPRAFMEPRSDTRKNVDLFFLQAMHPTAGQPHLAGVPVVRGPAVPGPGGVPIATGPPPAWTTAALPPGTGFTSTNPAAYAPHAQQPVVQFSPAQPPVVQYPAAQQPFLQSPVTQSPVAQQVQLQQPIGHIPWNSAAAPLQ